MVVQKYKEMLKAKSVIRQLSEAATARGKEIGYENVFDYSLGNPSVPVPRKVTDTMLQMLQEKKLPFEVSVEPCESQVGGGAFPTEHLQGYGVVLTSRQKKCQDIVDAMEQLPVPVICRCQKDQIILDVRTLEKEDTEMIVRELELL